MHNPLLRRFQSWGVLCITPSCSDQYLFTEISKLGGYLNYTLLFRSLSFYGDFSAGGLFELDPRVQISTFLRRFQSWGVIMGLHTFRKIPTTTPFHISPCRVNKRSQPSMERFRSWGVRCISPFYGDFKAGGFFA